MITYEGLHIMKLSTISTMSTTDLWKIYTYFILKLFSKCYIAQQKPRACYREGVRLSAERSNPMANTSRLCKQSVYVAIKPYGGRPQFSVFLERKKENTEFKF